jgi:hypothetical protein
VQLNHVKQTIQEFSEQTKADGVPWLIQKGSSLCQYDSRYFFLAFKQENNPTIQYRWNLPPEMNSKLEDLRRVADLPEEQAGRGFDVSFITMMVLQGRCSDFRGKETNRSGIPAKSNAQSPDLDGEPSTLNL